MPAKCSFRIIANIGLDINMTMCYNKKKRFFRMKIKNLFVNESQGAKTRAGKSPIFKSGFCYV